MQQKQKSKMPDREDCLTMARNCLSHNLRKTERIITRHYDSYLAPAGVTAVQLPILAIIAAVDDPSPRFISEQIGLDRSTLSRNLALLERDGFIVQGPSSGPKPGIVSLTAKGREALRRAHPRWRAAHESMESILSAEQLTRVLEMLKSLRRRTRETA